MYCWKTVHEFFPSFSIKKIHKFYSCYLKVDIFFSGQRASDVQYNFSIKIFWYLKVYVFFTWIPINIAIFIVFMNFLNKVQRDHFIQRDDFSKLHTFNTYLWWETSIDKYLSVAILKSESIFISFEISWEHFHAVNNNWASRANS